MRAFNTFMKMVSDRILLARVTRMSNDTAADGVVMSVCLCDTSGVDDVHIQDVLTQSGLAIYQQDIHQVIIFLLLVYHLFPSCCCLI